MCSFFFLLQIESNQSCKLRIIYSKIDCQVVSEPQKQLISLWHGITSSVGGTPVPGLPHFNTQEI